MFVFGHVGLTWGGALLLAEASRRLRGSGRRRSGPMTNAQATRRLSDANIAYRFVIFGSLLPDLIDKPLGLFILRKQISNGRTFAHSLLFASLIGLTSLARPGKARRVLAPLALGSAAHLVLDRMWMQPNVLFWPLQGWLPERQDVSHWLEQMLEQLLSDPYTYVSEALGAGAIAGLLASLLKGHHFHEFIRTGWMRSSLAAGEEGTQQMQGRQRPAER